MIISKRAKNDPKKPKNPKEPKKPKYPIDHPKEPNLSSLHHVLLILSVTGAKTSLNAAKMPSDAVKIEYFH